MTRIKSTCLALVALLLSPMAANADQIAGFNGDYDVANWNETITCLNDLAGGVDTSSAPNSIALVECDSNIDVTTGFVTFDILAVADGIFSFDWNMGGFDWGYAEGGYILDGVLNFLSNNFNGDGESGSISVAVLAGQTIGWYNQTYDNCCGTTALTISNFSAPIAAVPEPGTLALFGIGLLGMGLTRRKKKA